MCTLKCARYIHFRHCLRNMHINVCTGALYSSDFAYATCTLKCVRYTLQTLCNMRFNCVRYAVIRQRACNEHFNVCSCSQTCNTYEAQLIVHYTVNSFHQLQFALLSTFSTFYRIRRLSLGIIFCLHFQGHRRWGVQRWQCYFEMFRRTRTPSEFLCTSKNNSWNGKGWKRPGRR